MSYTGFPFLFPEDLGDENYLASTEQVEFPPDPQPGDEDGQAYLVAYAVNIIYNNLLQRHTNLRPADWINEDLSNLVAVCTKPHSEHENALILSYFSEVQVAQLRRMCGKAEGYLEQHHADLMIKKLSEYADFKRSGRKGQPPKPTLMQTLREFPYFENYEHLTKLEYGLISPHLPPSIGTAAFIGSGPLPLSSLLTGMLMPGTKFLNLDRNKEALDASKQLYTLLRKDDKNNQLPDMDFIQFNAGAAENQPPPKGLKWQGVGLIFLASLVGENMWQKMEILRGLRRFVRPGTLVAVRSAWGLRTLLYPVFELEPKEILQAGYEIVAVTHPYSEVVNSCVLLRAVKADKTNPSDILDDMGCMYPA